MTNTTKTKKLLGATSLGLVALAGLATASCTDAANAGAEIGADAGAPVDPGEPENASPDAGTEIDPAALIAHWQVNIEWVVEDMGEDEFQNRVTEKPNLPDIISAQELWPKPVCGQMNAKGQEALLAPQECLSEDYGARSFMGILNEKTGREYALRYMAKSANAVIWAKDRFEHVDSSLWSFGQTQALRNACCAGASSEAGCAQSRNIGLAVLLKDNRLTPNEDDDTFVGVASVHTGGWGGACVQAHLDQAERAFEDWEASNAGQSLSRRFISGDLNTRPDRSSSTAAGQKQERNPACWWRGFVKGHSCGGRQGEYIDTVWKKQWDGDQTNNAKICSQWTFPMNSQNTKCDVIEDSAGQVYQRIDYTFLKAPGLAPAQLRSHVDKGYRDNNGNGRFDFGEAYSNSHRGIYTEVGY